MKTLNFRKQVSLLVSIVLLFIFAFTNLAFAAEVNFKTMHVSVKPEYDKEQKIFYMYQAKLYNTGDVSVYAPKEIINDQTIQFCALTPQNQHLCQPREKTEEGIYAKFSGNIPQKAFMFEGYSQNIKDSNGQRSFQYSFKAAQNIDELNVAIVEPKGASNYKVKPASQSTTTDSDGLNNHTYTYKNVKKGTEYKFDASYTKTGWDVSKIAQTNDQTGATTGGGISGWTIFGAIVAALVVAGGALFAFARFSGQGGVGSIKPTPVAPKGKARFCTNCGTRLGGGKFCPNCGAKASK